MLTCFSYTRSTLALTITGLLLSGCATIQQKDKSAAAFGGSSRLDISHVVTRADDGSLVFVTVDGKDAGALIGGQKATIPVKPGEHKVSAYVQTLLGFGRVTIAPLTVRTKNGEIKKITYSVNGTQPGFVVTGSEMEQRAPQPVPVQPTPQQASQPAATSSVSVNETVPVQGGGATTPGVSAAVSPSPAAPAQQASPAPAQPSASTESKATSIATPTPITPAENASVEQNSVMQAEKNRSATETTSPAADSAIQKNSNTTSDAASPAQ